MSKLMGGQSTLFNALVNPLGFMMPKQHTLPTPAPARAAPLITDPLVQGALASQAAAQARGYGSTILTSGQGTARPNVAKKQLLGG